MGLKVGEDVILFRLPLGKTESLESLVFCHGLETYGVIAPNLGGYRPRVTRQPLYSLKELPKSLYLFVSEKRIEGLDSSETGAFLLQQADAYVYEWNEVNPESRLHARGSAPIYEEERDDNYVNSDGGGSWVHDPLTRIALEAEGVHRASAEDLGSGKNILDNSFSRYEKDVLLLSKQWVIANEVFRFLPGKEKYYSSAIDAEVVRLHPLQARNRREAESNANLFRDKAKAHMPEGIKKEEFCDKSFIYKPFRLNGEWLTYTEVMELEQKVLGMGHHVNESGILEVLGRERVKETAFLTCPYPFEKHLDWRSVYTKKLYPELPMGYFIAGIEADRPHAQALGFYQVMEHEARRHGMANGNDQAALKNLLMDTGLLSHEQLEKVFCRAFYEGDDICGLRGSRGNLDRSKLGEIIYGSLRNPVVHAGGYGRNGEVAISPYSVKQFSPRFMRIVRITRELARHFVSRTGAYSE